METKETDLSKVLEQIKEKGCKVYIDPMPEKLNQCQIRLMLERNLKGTKRVVVCHSFADVVKGLPQFVKTRDS